MPALARGKVFPGIQKKKKTMQRIKTRRPGPAALWPRHPGLRMFEVAHRIARSPVGRKPQDSPPAHTFTHVSRAIRGARSTADA
jgi:hypothetical protein